MKKYRIILSSMAVSGDSKYLDFVYEAEDINQVMSYLKEISCGIVHVDIKELPEDEKIKINYFDIKPDDIIVLETEEYLTEEVIKKFKEAINGVIPNKILLLERLKMSIIKNKGIEC